MHELHAVLHALFTSFPNQAQTVEASCCLLELGC